jgi:hypothetical protein
MKHDRMTKNLGLVLISSSLILAGCSRHSPEQDPNQNAAVNGSGGTNWWYFHHSTGGFTGSGPGATSGGFVSGGGARSGGFTASSSVSSRGGFGASGHAFGGSGA